MTEFSVWCQSCQSTGGDGSWANAQGIASFLLNLLAEGASAGLVYEAWDGQWISYNTSTGQDTAPVWDFWGLFAVDNINAVPKTYTPRKQFYTVSQITKYVAPGAIRIGVGGASTPLTLLAFYNTNNGQFTLTGVNTTSSASSLIVRAGVAAGDPQCGPLLHLQRHQSLLRGACGGQQRRFLRGGAGGLRVHTDVQQHSGGAGGAVGVACERQPANPDLWAQRAG